MDYRNLRAEHTPIHIDGAVVERIESFKFLCVHIPKELSRSTHSNIVMKRARQCLFPLRRLKKIDICPQILKKLYRCTIESIIDWLHHCLVWQLFGIQLQDSTEGGASSPAHHCGQDPCHPGPLYQAVSEERKFVKDSSHPSHT